MVGDVVIGIVSGAAGFLGAALWEIGPPESSQPSVREADRTSPFQFRSQSAQAGSIDLMASGTTRVGA